MSASRARVSLFLRHERSPWSCAEKRGARKQTAQSLGFARTAQWAEGLPVYTTGLVGLAFFLQRQFRYHLRQHIFEQMRQLEAQPDVLQLEHRSFTVDDDESFHSTILGSAALPHTQGGLSVKGQNWAADRELEKRSFDLPTMDLEWVRHTDDKLFRTMSRLQRHLLYLVYVRELNWKETTAAWALNGGAPPPRRKSPPRRKFPSLFFTLSLPPPTTDSVGFRSASLSSRTRGIRIGFGGRAGVGRISLAVTGISSGAASPVSNGRVRG
jgi:hypothetical protein